MHSFTFVSSASLHSAPEKIIHYLFLRLLGFSPSSPYINEKQGDCERKAREAGEMGICYNEDKSTYTITAVNNIIEAIVTNKGHVAAKWVDDILLINHGHLSDLIVGFDLEWCPNTLYGTRGENPVALLQLCVGHRCLIFQLLYCDFIPDKLCDFLKDYRHRFVGVGIKEDAEKLERGYELEVAHAYDLRDFAVMEMDRNEMRHWGLQSLVREIMGVHMEKPRYMGQDQRLGE
ncbi:uncharacterized protein LOC144547079 [Carex rostrata]